jgi:methylated-DNA-[protein]-cysteine S-methyltransferase
MPSLRHATISTPIGDLTIVCSRRGVVATIFEDDDREATLDRIADVFAEAAWPSDVHENDGSAATVATAAHREAAGYLRGRSRSFSVLPDLSLVPGGFATKVLEVVASIPYGELWTYGDVAGMAGSPRAARAAGSALAACPIELFVPCHRVVHAGGTIGGYGRHEDRKRWLLRHEGAMV